MPANPNDSMQEAIQYLTAASIELRGAIVANTAQLLGLPDQLKAWSDHFLVELGLKLEAAGGAGSGGGNGGPEPEEEPEEKKSRFRQWVENRLINSAGELASRSTSAAGGEVSGLAGRGAAMAAGEGGGVAALGAAAAPIAILLATVGALKSFHAAVVQAAKAQQSHNFQYAGASAAMAGVQVQTEIADAFRDRKIGDSTAGTAQTLADANRRYDDTAAQFEILWSNFKNMGIAAALNVITGILKPIGDVAEEVSEWIGTEKPEAGDDMATWMDATERKTEQAKNAGREWLQRKF